MRKGTEPPEQDRQDAFAEGSGDALLERISRVEKLLEERGPEVAGDRVRRLRLRQGLSIRQLADRAGLNKNSIVRLEQGRGSAALTIIRVCAAFQIHIDRLLDEEGPGVTAAYLHQTGDDRWADLRDLASAPVRRRSDLDADALAACILESRIPDGRLRASILEIAAATDPRSHVGEEFVYVLEGRLAITIAGTRHALAAGESIAFHSAETHSYAPAAQGESVRLLSVRVEGS